MARFSTAMPEPERGGRITITSGVSRLLAIGMALALAASCSSDREANIGTQIDAPGFAYQNVETLKRSGFDVDFYMWFAKFNDTPFTPVPVELTVDDRENALRDGRVDYVFGSHSITGPRDEKIDFAGPYLENFQGIMVRADDDRLISKPSQLAGLTVCAEIGSTSIRELEKIGGVITVEDHTLTSCVNRLLAENGDVDAVSTDQILLYGHERERPGELRVLRDVRFGPIQRYGIGLPPEKGTENCERVTRKIREYLDSGAWDRAFMDNLGKDLDRSAFKPTTMRECVSDIED